MTLSLELAPDLEQQLQERARATGQDIAQYVLQTLQEKVQRKPTVDELLAPFRKQVEESGMTDEELEAFFEEVRDEVWREKHGKHA
jgi:hypothetical protein